MCGIAGELRYVSSPSPVDWPRISQMMARRGPDDAGVWSDGEYCSLVFRRLSILDLTPTGNQPMLDASGRFALVFNGEVYNFQSLRRELETKGYSFRSTGDAEVVLYTLITWGVEALDRFNGMFALAFYDTVEKRLLLARDHAGIKPLYYLHSDNGLIFASQFDQLLAHPWGRSCRVSEAALGLYLRMGYIPAPYTLLDEAHMLEPGCWLKTSPGGPTTTGRYFDFPANAEPRLRGVEAVEAVDAAVTNAVRRQLISDVPVAAFLSGGIDSPLVAAKMVAATSDGPMRAFTIGTDDPATDESEDAAAYAHELGLDHVLERFSPAQAFDLLGDVIAACGEPFADYSIFPTMLVCRLASREVKVMLSGDGGDELFWGYPGRFGSVIEKAADFRQSYWWRSTRRAASKYLHLGDGYANLRWPTIGAWYRAKHSYLSEANLRQMFPRLPEWPGDFPLFDYDGWEVDQTALWLRYNEFAGHLTRVLLKVDRASMYHSLEVRVPLLDREVIDTAAKIDWRTCLDIERGIGKIPLRESLSRHVKHQSTKKRGFAVPMDHWMRGALRPVVEEVLLSRFDLAGLPLDQKGLRAFYDRHLSGGADYGWGLWVLLSLALWEDRHYCLIRERSQ
ncbi:MAG: asparagine synthase (glutamine-hydrolyzing) [Anaerolineae bacterium]|nr:asparagine synthase (glutamine-hydrolyzing) [Anaerolineae bacterium]